MNSGALQTRKAWLGIGALLTVVIVVASWFLFISPELDSNDALQQQVTDAQWSNTQQLTKNAKLAKDYSRIDASRKELAAAMQALPAGSGLSDFTAELTRAAEDSHVNLTSIIVGNIAPATTGSGTSTPATTTDTQTQTAAPAPASTAPAGAPAATVGQFAITMTLASSGKYSAQLDFLKRVADGPRRALITGAQVGQSKQARVGSVDGSTTLTTQLTVFSAPLTAEQAAQLKALPTPPR